LTDACRPDSKTAWLTVRQSFLDHTHISIYQ
jgi:hypothetical protein